MILQAGEGPEGSRMVGLITSGFGTGIDIKGLVAQLVQASRLPVARRLDQREAAFQSDISALGTLKSTVSKLVDSVKALKETASYEKRNAASSDPAVFTATATSSAVAGVYSVEVVQLAKAHKIRSTGFTNADTVVGTGTMTLSLGADAFTVTVGASSNTLAQIRDSINGHADNKGILASIVNVDDGAGGTESRLVLTSSKTGAANTLKVTVTDDDGNNTNTLGLSRLVYDPPTTANMTQLDAAQDAQIRVDGQLAASANGIFIDVIQGVTINTVKADPGITKTLTISLDKKTIEGLVKDFVAKHNDLVKTTKGLGKYDPKTGKRGALNGDSSLRGIEGRVRSEIHEAVEANATYKRLADVGVTMKEDGTLTLDEAKLSTAIDNKLAEVKAMFTSDDGYGVRLEKALSGFVDSTGVLQKRIDGLNERVKDIGEDRVALDRRMDALEQRLLDQFNAMDALVAELTATSARLDAQLKTLPGFTRRRD